MAHISIRTIKGRKYKYVEESYRNAQGQPRKRYISCTPLDGPAPRKKLKKGGGGLGGLTVPTFIMSALVVAAKAATGTLGPPGGRKYAERHHKPVSRAEKVYRAQERVLNTRAGMDMSSREAYEKSLAHMTPETYQEWVKGGMELSRAMHAAKAAERSTKEIMSMAGIAPAAPVAEAPMTDPSEAPVSDDTDSEVSGEGS